MTQILAGVGRCDITPCPGTPQGGWGAQIHQRGTTADAPFYATALALSDATRTVVIIEVDSIGFDPRWTAKIMDRVAALTGLPSDRIRFSCSHTHSGPNTFRLDGLNEGLDMAVSYMESLPDRIAGAGWQAVRNLRPVRVGAATGACGINVNRRYRVADGRVVVGENPNAPADPTLQVLRFDDLNERPIAIVIHYACHPTTIAWQSELFTPDFPGPAREVISREFGCPALFLQGAAADLGPRGGFTGDLADYHRLGRRLGYAAAELAMRIETVEREQTFAEVMPSGAFIALYNREPRPDVPIAFDVQTRIIQLPLKSFSNPADLEVDLMSLRKKAAQMRAAGDEAGLRLAHAMATQAGWRADNARMYHGKQFTERQLQAIRIGRIVLLSMPGEPFSSLGKRIRENSPFPYTLFSGYSNGGFGYIPDPLAYEEGGYEIEVTPFSPDSGDVVVASATKLLQEMHDPGLVHSESV